jgi:hypothetical protein
MSEPCQNCDGKGAYPKWTGRFGESDWLGLCDECGGRGHSGPAVGWLCGSYAWPSTFAPVSPQAAAAGKRQALVLTKDGSHPLLGDGYWRVRLALDSPYVKDGRTVGSGKRTGVDGRGRAVSASTMVRAISVSGSLAGPDDRHLLKQLGGTFDGCIQIAGEFTRVSWRGTWNVQYRDFRRVVFTGEGYMLDKVH